MKRESDTIEDDWIESIEKLEEMMDRYIHLRRQVRDVFEMRYQATIDPDRHKDYQGVHSLRCNGAAAYLNQRTVSMTFD